MKKENSFVSDFLGGFKALFGTTHNVKLVLLLVLLVFLVVFIILGGFGAGLPLCAGGADGDGASGQSAGCAGVRGEDVYAEGLHSYDGFKELGVSCTDLLVFGSDIRASVYYPTDLFTLDPDKKGSFGDHVLVGANGYNLEIDSDYTGIVSFNGSSAQTFDELCQGLKNNTLKDKYTVCEELTVDGRRAIVVMSRYGYARVFVDCSDISERAVVVFYALPDTYETSDGLTRQDAADAFYDEQIQALIHTAVITPADMVPWLDEESGEVNMDVSFKTYADGRVQKAGHSFGAPAVSSVGDVFEDISFEAEDCRVDVLSAERISIPEEFRTSWMRGLIDVKLVFTNNSESPQFLEDIFTILAKNGHSSKYDYHFTNFDNFRTIAPGECILIDYCFDSFGDHEDFCLQWETLNHDTEEWEPAGEQLLLEGI